MAKLQFATLSNLQEFLNLHNVQIDSKISEAVKNSIKTVQKLVILIMAIVGLPVISKRKLYIVK